MSVTVVIPTLNEAGCIGAAIAAIRRQGAVEIIVVDGGSTDGTLDLAQGADVVLTAPPGRASQINAGAAKTSGTNLLFLHADCTLEQGAISAMDRALSQRSVAAGCFSMQVEANGIAYRSIDACATARVRLTGIVYGDQGLFVRRDVFERIGGFPSVPFMEDVLISQRLRRLGRIVVLPHRVFVSPRRWRKMGIVRQTLRNWSLTALALAGVAPAHLARFYPVVR